ncbi:LacI family DNA-binding transcriptional regulator [Kribbella shirazensis]|uniref:DNA-binding LacI/PurR family transcriptional regulator n=1 Tax=Kribbella shirazensis TaxID=1105143 RepID=A0A7X5V508_9ACTN|nr:LacI family DNA-binding transcriptional regulator [Kribbella shirazensis]NIK54702.1 DNA-binding LacI/PurR family transcriptional regulator [Kribbella shirazensis]
MAGGKRPSQRDIAERAQVSQTAVSLVLNGKSEQYGLSPETVAKVRAAMTALGYVPNISARTLRGGRNGLIGVHTFETLFPTSQQSYYFEFMIGVEEMAIATGQDLVLLTSAHQHEGDQSIYRGGVNRLRLTDGAVILGFNEDAEELSRLADEGFPFVFIGRREKVASLMPYVTVDYAGGMAAVAGHLADLGHRRVAYLGLPDRLGPRTERRTAFGASAEQASIEVQDQFFVSPADVGADWLTRLRDEHVTAAVVESGDFLPKVVELADAAGLTIPADLSVVCLDTPSVRTGPYDWAHTALPRRELGGRAVRVLLDFLDGHLPRNHREELPCELHLGQTLTSPAH